MVESDEKKKLRAVGTAQGGKHLSCGNVDWSSDPEHTTVPGAGGAHLLV